ncbi:MAG TPA: hypothetical protein VEJ19_00405 [Nitrososphaerales archaeon]|nr:hypothetical protein [Nitrososphaerales archaeon]
METDSRDESFWHEFPAISDYFARGPVKLLRPAKVTQENNYAGDAGTWCRRLAVDVS